MPKSPVDLLRRVKGRFSLEDIDPGETGGLHEEQIKADLEQDVRRLGELHDLLYASRRKALLVIFQGMDTAGKDSTVRHVMRGLAPQGCVVTSFKRPTAEEAGHDFLWRVHRHVPERGAIGIFDRSHYEDVLIVRVHGGITERQAERRLRAIRHFERHLAREDVVVRKFFLHISPDEQWRRLQERLADPAKRWKYSPQDLAERRYWDDYMRAYAQALSATSRRYAPWYVVPSDHKWLRNYLVAQVLVQTLAALDLHWPAPELPTGGPADGSG